MGLVIAIPVSLLLGVAEINVSIVFLSRLPRLLALVLAGAGLTMAGIILQGLARNSFVGPETTGALDAARLGWLVSLIIVPTWGFWASAGLAMVSACLGMVLFFLLLRALPPHRHSLAPLLGLMVAAIYEGAIQALGLRFDLLQSLSAREQGDFSLISAGRWELMLVVLPIVLAAVVYARHFTLAGLGKNQSTSLGLKYRQVQYLGFVMVSLVLVAVLASAGRIPFLGLVVPALLRRALGDNVKDLLGHGLVYGPLALLTADIVGRIVVYPFEIPVSITMAVLGGLLFLVLIRRSAL